MFIGNKIDKLFCSGKKLILIIKDILDVPTALSLDKNFNGAVRELKQLEDLGRNSNRVNVILLRNLKGMWPSTADKDLLLILISCIHYLDRLCILNEQGNDHMRKYNDVLQGQNSKDMLRCLNLHIS